MQCANTAKLDKNLLEYEGYDYTSAIITWYVMMHVECQKIAFFLSWNDDVTQTLARVLSKTTSVTRILRKGTNIILRLTN